MNAIGYIRISQRNSSYDGVSLEVQAEGIKAYCKFKGYNLVAIYGDPFLSGKNIKDRPGINAVLTMADKKRMDAIVVYKLDRFMRNTIELLDTCAFLEDRGVAFCSVNEEINTKTAIGKFFLTVLGALGQMEREQISERTKAAMGLKRDKQERISLRAPYGFRIIKGSKKLHRDYKERAAYERLMELRAMKIPYDIQGRVLKAEGFVNRAGKPYGVTDLFRMRKALAGKSWEELWGLAAPDPDYPLELQEGFSQEQINEFKKVV